MKFNWATILLLGSVAVTAQKDNYCERNETTRVLVPVTKQVIIVKPQSKWKIWKKPEKIVELHDSMEEQVTHQLVRECCPGYLQVESGLCEPICTRGCPAHASCAAPDRCECISGYISARSHQDGSHYCEPICQTQCPVGAQCVSPNTCACRDGYTQLQPTGDGVSADCAPICQVGDGCANGKCIDVLLLSLLLAAFEERSSSGCHVRLVVLAPGPWVPGPPHTAPPICRRALRRRRFAYCLFMYEGP